MSQAIIEIGKRVEGEFEPDENHAINVFFNSKPNPYYSWRQVWGATSDGYCVDGNAYWIKARDKHGLVQEVYWVPSHWIRVQTDPRGVIYKYIYTPGRLAQTVTAGGIEYDPDDIIHFRDSIDPLNPVMGLSTLKRNIRNVVGVNEGENYTARILANLGVPGVVFVPDSEAGYVDEPTAAMIAERWEQMTGGENRGKPMVMSRPMRMERLGLSPEELALDRVIDRPEAMIHASLGLNSLVTGCPSSDSTRTYSNLAEANKGAWENCVIPIQDAFAEHIKDGLSFEFDLDSDHVLQWNRSQIEALGEQVDARAARAVALFQATLYPRDRSLQQCGFDPVEGEDGELYYGEPTEEQARKAGLAAGAEEPEEEPNPDEEESNVNEDAGDEDEEGEGEGGGEGGSMMAWEGEGGSISDIPEEKAINSEGVQS